jgi:hypothetical protein
MTMEPFNRLFVPERRRGRTFVLDRGIYGLDEFARFMAAGDHVPTWEKGYAGGAWQEGVRPVVFARQRTRNHARDLRHYRFECQETPWPRDPRLRRIVVRATNPQNRTLEVSVLCSNPDMGLEEAVWLMFNRLRRERQQDRLQVAEQRTGQLRERRDGLAAQMRHALADLQAGTGNPSAAAALRRLADRLSADLRSVRGKAARARKALAKLDALIAPLKQQTADPEARLAAALRSQSRLQLLTDSHYRLLDTRCKATLDALRIAASNMFAGLAARFRSLYGNHRNDHVMLRQLTRADGFLHRDGQTVYRRLWLRGRFQRWQTRAFRRFLAEVASQRHIPSVMGHEALRHTPRAQHGVARTKWPLTITSPTSRSMWQSDWRQGPWRTEANGGTRPSSKRRWTPSAGTGTRGPRPKASRRRPAPPRQCCSSISRPNGRCSWPCSSSSGLECCLGTGWRQGVTSPPRKRCVSSPPATWTPAGSTASGCGWCRAPPPRTTMPPPHCAVRIRAWVNRFSLLSGNGRSEAKCRPGWWSRCAT